MIPETSTRTGSLTSKHGDLPLEAMDVRARVIGLTWEAQVRQVFVNSHAEPLEATYVFPLPDRAAVHAVSLEIAGRAIPATLKERGQARGQYETAIATGKRAAMAEEDRPAVFTVTVGNLGPNERAVVTLELGGSCAFEAGEATFRFPLVVAPRYVPGNPVGGPQAGAGTQADTAEVPDASRISPPRLAPNATTPALTFKVTLSGGGLEVRELSTALHPLVVQRAGSFHVVRLPDGTAMDRDFILRWKLDADAAREGLVYAADPEGGEGTWQLTVCAGELSKVAVPRDVVFVLDRSGSMKGWKLEAAKRALGRILDGLSAADRFALLSFSEHVQQFEGGRLGPATDRRRFDGLQELATLIADGGTELHPALTRAAECLGVPSDARERTIVLVTDGQVANEDQLLRGLVPQLKGARVLCVGIDRTVSAGFLNRLADLTGGTSDLVESHDRLDQVLERMQQRILHAAVLNPLLEAVGPVISATQQPARLPHLCVGTPLVVMGRSRGPLTSLIVRGQTPDGQRWTHEARGSEAEEEGRALRLAWARAQVRSLEDRFAEGGANRAAIERELVDTSLKFGVLCRFTAFVLEDSEGPRVVGPLRSMQQPVADPSGWEVENGRAVAASPISFTHHRAASRSTRTQAGILRGKVSWLAPEQVRGMPLTQAIDVHHLGMVLHHALTLERLYQADSELAILQAVLKPVALPIFTDPYLAQFEDLVARMLDVTPENRPTAREVVRALDLVLAGFAPDLGAFAAARFPDLVRANQELVRRAEQLAPAANECLVLERLSIDDMFSSFPGVIRGADGASKLVLAAELLPYMREDDAIVEYLIDVALNDHPGVLSVREISRPKENAMWQLREWHAGVPLRQLLQQERKAGRSLPPPVALAIVRAVASTVADLHSAGTIVRNIEPDEICVCFDGRVIVAVSDDGPGPRVPIVERTYVELKKRSTPVPPPPPLVHASAQRTQPWYAFWK